MDNMPHGSQPIESASTLSSEPVVLAIPSLRDYFAAQWVVGASQFWAHTAPERLAKEAYVMADAMLKERTK